MAQLSRPYQIGLLVIAVLAAVWVVALRPHGASSSSSSASSAPAVTTATTTPAASGGSTGQAGAASKIYHGSAPGVQGLSSAIAKAHGAVATSEQNAAQLEAHSAQASSASNAPVTATPATSGAAATSVTVAKSTTTTARHGAAATSTTVATATVAGKTQPIQARSGAGRVPARQALVERALKEGKPAVILIWNPKGADDVAVRNELLILEAVHHLIKSVPHSAQLRKALAASGLELQKKFAAFIALQSQVSSFGSITRGVQVFGTPTMLFVSKSGQTAVITGLTTAFAIEQAIDEARHA